MANSYRAPIVRTPYLTKPSSPELLKKDDEQNRPPAVKKGEMPVMKKGNTAMETGRTKEQDPTLPPSRKIVIPNLKLFTQMKLKVAMMNFKQTNVLREEGGFGRVSKGLVNEKTYTLSSKVGIGMVNKSNPDSL